MGVRWMSLQEPRAPASVGGSLMGAASSVTGAAPSGSEGSATMGLLFSAARGGHGGGGRGGRG